MSRRAILIPILALGLCAPLAVVPERADARGIIPGIMGMMTRPFHALFGGYRHSRHSHSRGAAAAPAAAGAAAVRPEDAQAAAPAPVVWPSAYEDVLGYTLWPQDYGPRLQAHGYSDILAAVFEPADRTGSIRPKVSETTGSAAGNGDAANACGDDQSSSTQSSAWPAEKLEQTLQLDDAQKKSLDQLRAATVEANKVIQASCGDEASSAPAERLRSMQNRLWAVRDATVTIRASLQSFYDSLNDDQKKQFVVETAQPDPRADAAKAPNLTRQQQQQQAEAARMCGAQALREWPGARIEQAVRPNSSQRASLEAFRKTSIEMGKLLMASCMKPTPPTPLDRLDRADERLTTLIFAASTVNLALNDFYGQLSDRQKKQFDSVKR